MFQSLSLEALLSSLRALVFQISSPCVQLMLGSAAVCSLAAQLLTITTNTNPNCIVGFKNLRNKFCNKHHLYFGLTLKATLHVTSDPSKIGGEEKCLFPSCPVMQILQTIGMHKVKEYFNKNCFTLKTIIKYSPLR